MTTSDPVPDDRLEAVVGKVPTHSLVGIEIASAGEVSVLTEEGAIANELLGDFIQTGIIVNRDNPSENLVIATAARNLQRAQGEGREKDVFIDIGHKILIGVPASTSGTSIRRQSGQMSHFPARGTVEGMPNYDTYESVDGRKGRRAAYSTSSQMPWGFNLEELEANKGIRARLAQLREQFVSDHPLGEGAVLVTNRYGGIDPSDIEGSTRSIVARMMLADELCIADNPESYEESIVKQGLLDEKVYALVGGSWNKLRKTIRPSLTTIAQLMESGQDTDAVMPVIETLVRGHVEQFLHVAGPSVALASQLLSNPERSNRIISALMRKDEGFKGVLKAGAVDEFRRR